MEEVYGGSLVCERIARESQAGAPSVWDPHLMCFRRVVLRRALPLDRPAARSRWDAHRAFPPGRVPQEEEDEEKEDEEEDENEDAGRGREE
eukprot:525083-Pyramimonas_sp.AAC.1